MKRLMYMASTFLVVLLVASVAGAQSLSYIKVPPTEDQLGQIRAEVAEISSRKANYEKQIAAKHKEVAQIRQEVDNLRKQREDCSKYHNTSIELSAQQLRRAQQEEKECNERRIRNAQQVVALEARADALEYEIKKLSQKPAVAGFLKKKYGYDSLEQLEKDVTDFAQKRRLMARAIANKNWAGIFEKIKSKETFFESVDSHVIERINTKGSNWTKAFYVEWTLKFLRTYKKDPSKASWSELNKFNSPISTERVSPILIYVWKNGLKKAKADFYLVEQDLYWDENRTIPELTKTRAVADIFNACAKMNSWCAESVLDKYARHCSLSANQIKEVLDMVRKEYMGTPIEKNIHLLQRVLLLRKPNNIDTNKWLWASEKDMRETLELVGYGGPYSKEEINLVRKYVEFQRGFGPNYRLEYVVRKLGYLPSVTDEVTEALQKWGENVQNKAKNSVNKLRGK